MIAGSGDFDRRLQVPGILFERFRGVALESLGSVSRSAESRFERLDRTAVAGQCVDRELSFFEMQFVEHNVLFC